MKRLLLNLILFAFAVAATAQQQMPQIPTDPKVRVGKLDNGLTYIIRHNERPKNQADFYIAQKVGSILEEDNQQGLAHFLEHMCFNGTKHFPGKALTNWLESVGVKFGANLNAYTSIDETVYNISSVPLVRESITDSCLLILSDWSCGLTLDTKEIDAERGVIHEEWRTRENANLRMITSILPKAYQGDKYAYRMPIGKMEVVDNFKPKALRDYYKKWYRPDQQCIIVVGDIDVDKIEAKIKALFSPIKMPKKAAPREYVKVTDNVEPIVCIAQDKENPSTSFSIMIKHDPIPVEMRQTPMYYVNNFAVSAVSTMLNSRLAEMSKKPDCSFLGASVGDSQFLLSANKYAFTASAVFKEDSVMQAMSLLSREIQRAAQFGFTPEEYERVKINTLKSYEVSYNERDNQFTDGFSKEYVRYFTQDEPSAGIEMEYQIMQMVVNNLPLDEVNKYFKQLVDDSKNLVILFEGPEKEGYVPPTEEQLLAAYNAPKSETLTAYVDNTPKEPLMTELPTPGTIVKEEKGKFGSTVLTLSNGVRVVVKPTDFKADEISMSAYSPGGSSLFGNDEIVQISVFNDVVSLGGLSKFSNDDLRKMLAGKTASASTSVSGMYENASGGCTNKDFETMLQLNYLNFTAPRQDMEAYDKFRQSLRLNLEQQEKLPETEFGDSVTFAVYNGHPRSANMKADWVDRINYDRCMEMYRERFADASDFTFVFVGNIDLETARPLFCQYLASLPSTGRKETWKDNGMRIRKGEYKNVVHKELQTKKASVIVLRTGDVEYNLRNNLMLNMISQALNTIYLEEVREKEGGTYGVSVGASLNRYPVEQAVIQISFDTDPARRADMTKIVKDQLERFIATGPTPESLQKIKEYMLKSYTQNQRENGYWMGRLVAFYQDGMDNHTDYEKIVNSITIADLCAMTKKILSQNNEIEISLTDER